MKSLVFSSFIQGEFQRAAECGVRPSHTDKVAVLMDRCMSDSILLNLRGSKDFYVDIERNEAAGLANYSIAPLG